MISQSVVSCFRSLLEAACCSFCADGEKVEIRVREVVVVVCLRVWKIPLAGGAE